MKTKSTCAPNLCGLFRSHLRVFRIFDVLAGILASHQDSSSRHVLVGCHAPQQTRPDLRCNCSQSEPERYPNTCCNLISFAGRSWSLLHSVLHDGADVLCHATSHEGNCVLSRNCVFQFVLTKNAWDVPGRPFKRPLTGRVYRIFVCMKHCARNSH